MWATVPRDPNPVPVVIEVDRADKLLNSNLNFPTSKTHIPKYDLFYMEIPDCMHN